MTVCTSLKAYGLEGLTIWLYLAVTFSILHEMVKFLAFKSGESTQDLIWAGVSIYGIILTPFLSAIAIRFLISSKV